MTRRGHYSLSGFILGILVSSLTIGGFWLAASPALAVVCSPGGHGLVGGENGGNHFGTRTTGTGMAVHDDPQTICLRVSSVYVLSDSQNLVEVGWFKGHDGVGNNCIIRDNPRTFAVKMVAGTQTCYEGASLASDNWANFSVKNNDKDHRFTFALNGNDFAELGVNFSEGESFLGSERHNADDSPGGEFYGLKFLGAGGNWNSFTDVILSEDVDNWIACGPGDPGYSNTHVALKHTC